ncbi:peptide transporter Ptr2p [Trichomonascus vanleenenianus]|uniref:peptide transporter Ptr2p n=1 Tax=Trichomonascus vanleenenianus TaxID=2268995 RepID=UPI003ECB55CA
MGSSERLSDEKVEALDHVASHTQGSVVLDENAKGPAPTEEELSSLRKVADSLPMSAWLVAVVELCERFTYNGISGPFQNYMQLERHTGPGSEGYKNGGLGLGQQSATALSYFFQFWCYVTPILGAVVADRYVGKYKAICIFSAVYVVGNATLFITSLPFSLNHGGGLGGLVAAMIIIGVGAGGIKSNVGPMIADQYTNTKPFVKELKSGERVIVDPAVTVESLFLIFYFCINFGSLSSIATTNLEKDVDFWAGFLLPFLFFFVGILALILGRNKYLKRPPQGSVLPDALRIICIGAKNKFNLNVAKPSVREANGLAPVLWSDLFVDEVRRALYACKVFIFYPIFWVVYGQMVNNFISQAGQMNLHGIPNDLMQSINPISIMIMIPLVNKFLYPGLRKIGIQMKPITRITCGFMAATLAMVYAAIVQHLIYQAGPCYDQPLACPASDNGRIPNDIHVAIQTPAYIFIGLAEIFASVTGLEYAYTKAPANMKSFIMSMYLLTNAFGSALGIALSSTAVDPKLLWMYTGLAGATFVAGWVFYFIFRHYNKLEDELNIIDAEYTAEMNAKLKAGKPEDIEDAHHDSHKAAHINEL